MGGMWWREGIAPLILYFGSRYSFMVRSLNAVEKIYWPYLCSPDRSLSLYRLGYPGYHLIWGWNRNMGFADRDAGKVTGNGALRRKSIRHVMGRSEDKRRACCLKRDASCPRPITQFPSPLVKLPVTLLRNFNNKNNKKETAHEFCSNSRPGGPTFHVWKRGQMRRLFNERLRFTSG
jgi:hypothetical protein